MIWGFEQLLKEDDEAEFYDHSRYQPEKHTDLMEAIAEVRVDEAGLKQHQERRARAFRLFGKYFQNLWD